MESFKIHGFGFLGDVPEEVHDEAAQCFIVVFRFAGEFLFDVEMFAEVVDAAQPFHEPGIVGPADEPVLFFFHILRVAGHVAHDFLEDVMECDEAGEHAVFVDDDGFMDALVVEVLEDFHEGKRLGDVYGLAEHGPEGFGDGVFRMLVAVHEDVAHVHDAEEVIEGAPPYGEAEMVGFLEGLPDVRFAVLDIDPVEAGPGGHAVRGGEVVQLEYAVHEDGLGLVEGTEAGALLEKDADLFLGDGLFLAHIDADEPDDQLGGPGADEHEGPAKGGEHEHGLGNGAGGLFRNGDSQPFRRELAQNESGVGDQRNDDSHGQSVRIGRQRGEFSQLVRQRHSEGGPGEHTGENADGGDADLDGGEKVFRIFRDPEGVARFFIAFFLHLAELRFPRAHDGNLRHGADAVENNQYKNNQ